MGKAAEIVHAVEVPLALFGDIGNEQDVLPWLNAVDHGAVAEEPAQRQQRGQTCAVVGHAGAYEGTVLAYLDIGGLARGQNSVHVCRNGDERIIGMQDDGDNHVAGVVERGGVAESPEDFDEMLGAGLLLESRGGDSADFEVLTVDPVLLGPGKGQP